MLSEGGGCAPQPHGSRPKIHSTMAQTSIHFQAVKGGSEEHNKRTKKLDYVHHERSSMNDYWQSDSQEARLAFVTANAKAKTGRKMQAKATPIREAVVVIEDTTTMDDLKNWRSVLTIASESMCSRSQSTRTRGTARARMV